MNTKHNIQIYDICYGFVEHPKIILNIHYENGGFGPFRYLALTNLLLHLVWATFKLS